MTTLLNGMDTIPKSGSLHKSILLVCLFIAIRGKVRWSQVFWLHDVTNETQPM